MISLNAEEKDSSIHILLSRTNCHQYQQRLHQVSQQFAFVQGGGGKGISEQGMKSYP